MAAIQNDHVLTTKETLYSLVFLFSLCSFSFIFHPRNFDTSKKKKLLYFRCSHPEASARLMCFFSFFHSFKANVLRDRVKLAVGICTEAETRVTPPPPYSHNAFK